MQHLTNRIKFLAQHPQTSLTLNNLYNLSKYRNNQSIIDSGRFLHNELPIRLSRRVMELDTLKFGLAKNPNILSTKDLYQDSVEKVLTHRPIETIDDAISLKDVVKDIKKVHQNVVPTMSKAVLQVAPDLQPCEKAELDEFLNSFYGSRIGVRTIMGQYIAVVEDHPTGIIQEVRPYEIFEDVANEVQMMSTICYSRSPDFKFHGDKNYSFTYIPAFLQYIYLETFKNAARSTIEQHESAEELPPINVYQSCGADDLIVKVSDQGGSFPRSDLPNVYSYSYTTVKEDPNPEKPIMAGLGYGVPLTRLYASYFGGDFQLIPFNGIGTDAIIWIHRLLSSTETEY